MLVRRYNPVTTTAPASGSPNPQYHCPSRTVAKREDRLALISKLIEIDTNSYRWNARLKRLHPRELHWHLPNRYWPRFGCFKGLTTFELDFIIGKIRDTPRQPDCCVRLGESSVRMRYDHCDGTFERMRIEHFRASVFLGETSGISVTSDADSTLHISRVARLGAHV